MDLFYRIDTNTDNGLVFELYPWSRKRKTLSAILYFFQIKLNQPNRVRAV